MWIRLRNVNRVTAKGRIYYYHRVTGERLPDDMDARVKRVLEIEAGPKAKPAAGPGSFSELVVAYKSSPEFRNAKPKTRKDYTAHLDWIAETWGDLPVSEIDREAIIEVRNTLQATPRKADYRIAVIRRLLSFAVERPRQFGLSANPALKIKRLHKTTGYPPWPDDVVTAALSAADAALARTIKGGLYTGQRGQDVVRMLWSHYDGSGIEAAQEKGGKRLWIPAHRDLRAALAETTRDQAVMFPDKRGQPWKLDHLRHEIAALMVRIGRPGFTFHGLRKAAAKRMAEAGCTAHQIAAVTGQSLQMVEHYTKGAEQRKMATAAVRKLERKRGDLAKPLIGCKTAPADRS